MSLPIKSHEIYTTITLSATQAEGVAEQIILTLKTAREVQEDNPMVHWRVPSEPIRIGESVQIKITPDKRHKGCSGYCHY